MPFARRISRRQSVCSASQLLNASRVYAANFGAIVACRVKSFPHTDISNFGFLSSDAENFIWFRAMEAIIPSNGMRMAWIRSG
jgi:hypothetical protein